MKNIILAIILSAHLILPWRVSAEEGMPSPQQEDLLREDVQAGEVPPAAAADFEESHKDKPAILLLYEAHVALNDDWSYSVKYRKRLKVQKEEAKDYGEIPVSYEKGRENIERISAWTVTPDGKRHKYTKIQDFALYEGYPMYTDSRTKMITLPEVNVGSVIEYEVTINAKRMPIKNAFWYSIDFGFTIPTKEVIYTLVMPKAFKMQYKEFGLRYKPAVMEDGKNVTYSWHIYDVYDEAADKEYLPPPDLDNVLDAVEVSSIQSWRDISDWYYGLAVKKADINEAIAGAARKAAERCETVRDKTRAVLEYIQDNFRYVSMSFGDNALEPHPTGEVFKNKYGDCKDLSLLCKAMLAAVGVKSYLALFGNEFSITDPQYDPPFPTLFDHVLLYVNDPAGGDFYADPLLKGYDIDEYPLSYQAAYTFVITENGGRFGRFPVFGEERSTSVRKQNITIGPDGSALTESEYVWDKDYSISTRAMINEMNEKEKKKFFENLDNIIASGGEIIERRIDGLENKYGILKSRSNFRQDNAYPITDGMIIIDLQGFGRGGDFVDNKREEPIFYPYNSLSEDLITYKIPEGFRLSSLPEPLDLDTGFFSIKRNCELKGGDVIVTGFERYKRVELPAEEYLKVKDFFDRLPWKTAQRIILKKAGDFTHSTVPPCGIAQGSAPPDTVRKSVAMSFTDGTGGADSFAEAVKMVKTGLSADDVKKILGEPGAIGAETDITLNGQEAVWTFKHPSDASARFIVIFRNGKVSLSAMAVTEGDGAARYPAAHEFFR